ncbi:hypothetical protein M758_UG077800 [Ceratodon purpureus]|nr:hypothetical protein M758_UG077800 [Ceratodon purpureus]
MVRFRIALSSSSNDEAPPIRDGRNVKRSGNVENERAGHVSVQTIPVHSSHFLSATVPNLTRGEDNISIVVSSRDHVVVPPIAHVLTDDVGSEVPIRESHGVNDNVKHITDVLGVADDGGLETNKNAEENVNIVLTVIANEEDSEPGKEDEENVEADTCVYSPVSEEEECENNESHVVQHGVTHAGNR